MSTQTQRYGVVYVEKVSKYIYGSALAAALLLVTGCSGSDDSSTVTAESKSSDDQEQTSSSYEGPVLAQIGETVMLESTDAVEVTVHGIALDPECTGYLSESPINGNFVALDVEVVVAEEAEGRLDIGNSDAFWRYQNPEGVVVNSAATSAAQNCFDASQTLRHSLNPGESARGVITLDISEPAGSIILEPAYDGYSQQPGFKWEF